MNCLVFAYHPNHYENDFSLVTGTLPNNQVFPLFMFSLPVKKHLFYEEGKDDQPSKEYSCQHANTCKVFLNHGVIRVELYWRSRGYRRTDCWSFVFLRHFYSPFIWLLCEAIFEIVSRERKSPSQ